MLINADTFRTIRFVNKYRRMGYTLLQNPWGTDRNEVSMILKSFDYDRDRYDKSYNCTKIHRKKSGVNFYVDKLNVNTTYFMDPKEHTYSGKNKKITVTNMPASEQLNYVYPKTTMSPETLSNRPLPTWENTDEKMAFEKNLQTENKKNEQGYKHNPGFLKILLQNLHLDVADYLKTTAFVLSRRFLGYKLFQNPKSTCPDDVTMGKSTLYLTPGGIKYDCVDKNYHLSVVHRFKKGGKYVKDKIFLMTTCFMDPKTRTYSHEEECYNGYSRKNGEAKYFDIPKVSDTNLKDRPSPNWECALSGEPVGEYKFRGKLFKEHRENGPYMPDAKVFENRPGFCLQLYNKVHDTDWHKLIKSNFWHVLKTNLNGGAE